MLNQIKAVVLVFLFFNSIEASILYNLNRATRDELVSIGLPVDVADKIIALRKTKPFKDVSELEDIPEVKPFYKFVSVNLYVDDLSSYRLRPEDVLHCYYPDQARVAVVKVSPDGFIMVNNRMIRVLGKTIYEVKNYLIELFGTDYDITLNKTEGYIYVIGEKGIATAGRYSTNSIIELSAMVSLDNKKFSGEIIIFRYGRMIRINHRDILTYRRPDVPLIPGDTVYFKKRAIWKIIEAFEPVGAFLKDITYLFVVGRAVGTW